MIVDLGTGDGRAVLARASADAGAFVIGIDATAPAMVEASRRAGGRRGAERSNACFLVAAAEALPGPLAGAASLVCVTLPWGSLLRGVLGLDGRILRGIASIVARDGRVEVLVSVIPSDHVADVDMVDLEAKPGIAAAWAAFGFEVASMRPASRGDLRATRSSWARRLGDRPAWRLDLQRSCPAG